MIYRVKTHVKAARGKKWHLIPESHIVRPTFESAHLAALDALFRHTPLRGEAFVCIVRYETGCRGVLAATYDAANSIKRQMR